MIQNHNLKGRKLLNRTVRAALALGLCIVVAGCSLEAQLQSLLQKNEKVSVDMTSPQRAATNATSIPVTVTLSETATDLATHHIQVVNGTIANFTSNGSTYSFDVIPNGDGVVSVLLPETELQFAEKKKQIESAFLVFNIDTVRPTVNLSTSAVSPTNAALIPVTVVFSEGVEGLEVSDFLISGGGASVVSLTGSGASYTLNVLASISGTVNIQLPQAVTQDASGNTNFASNAISIVYDNSIPVPVLASTAAPNNNLSSIPVTVDFSGISVVNLAASDFLVSNATITGFSGSGANYSLDLIPAADGPVTISLPPGVAENLFGTVNLGSTTLSFNVDRVAPTLSITGPVPATGNSTTSFVWTLNYTGASAVSLVAGDVSLGGTATAGCIKSVSGSGLTTRTVTVSGCTGNGNLNISVAANSAQDASGNQTAVVGPSSDALVDNLAPTISLSGPVPSAGNSATSFVWTVNYTSADAVSLTNADVILAGTATSGCNKSVSGTGTSARTVTISGCSGNGTLNISVAAGSASDTLGNQALAAGPSSDATLDNLGPSLTLGSPSPAVGNSAATFTWPVTYTDASSISLAASDVVLSGTATAGCVVNINGTGVTNRTIAVSGCSATSGTLAVSVLAGSALDSLGNAAPAAGPSAAVTIDNSNLTLGLSSTASPTNNLSVIPVTVTFSSATADFTAGDIQATNGSVTNFSGSGTTYTFDLTPSADGTVSVVVPAGAAHDSVPNANLASNILNFNVDRSVPTVTITGPTPTVGKSSTNFVWTVTYSNADAVTLANADITLGGTATAGCSKAVTGSGTMNRTVTLSNCTGNGSVNISVAANSAHDTAGNQALAAGPSSDATVDNSAPTLAITGPTPSLGNSSTSFEWTVTYTNADTVTLTSSNISLGGTATVGCAKSVTGSGTATRTVTISNCSGNGSLNISVAANSAQDTAGNQALAAGPSTNATVDNTAPTLAISGPTPTTGKSTTNFVWTVTYTNADSVTLADADISLGGTATASCTKAVSGSGTATRTVTISNCSGTGTLNISVAANSAQDSSGNSAAAAGPSSNATVDNTAPTISIAGPTPALGTSATSFVWTVNYTGASAVSLANGDITLIGTATAGCSSSVTGSGLSARTVTVSGCSGNGTVGIAVAANSAQDAVGNQSAADSSTLATVDNARPSLAITGPTPGTGNSSTSFVWTVTYTDADTVSLVAGNVTLAGATSGCTKNVSGSGTVTRTITISGCTGNGALTVSVAANSAQDTAGNQALAAGPSSSATVDNTRPTLSLSGPTPTSGNSSATIEWTVTYSGADTVTLSSTDVTLGGTATAGCAKSISGSGTTSRTVSVTGCTGNGTLTISIAANSAQDNAGNTSLAAGPSTSATIDNVAPSIAVSNPAASFVVDDTTNFAVSGTCSENGRAVTFTPTEKSAVTCTGGAWTAYFDLSAVVTEEVTIQGNLSDSAGNSASASRLFTMPSYKVTKIYNTNNAFAALRANGSLVAWGSSSGGGTAPASVTSANAGVVNVSSTGTAFAALKADGSVIAWGVASFGGSAPVSVTAANSGVKEIFSNSNAFAALKSDGSVVAWGDASAGGSAPVEVTAANSGVRKIFSNSSSFAAVKADGSVVAWGNSSYGGSAPGSVTAANSGVVKVFGTGTALAALKVDGSVVAWGNSSYGGSAPVGVTAANSQVVKIFNTNTSFAALKIDGSVVGWGSDTAPAGVTAANSGVINIVGNYFAFAALKSDGSVVTWGTAGAGGSAPASVTAANSKVVKISATTNAFAALKSDGSVVAWGSNGGSAPSSVTTANSDVVDLFSTESAFAALKSDGSVVAWGVSSDGGSAPASVTAANSGVVKIYRNVGAFAAIKSDGSVVTWGSSLGGGNSSSVAAKLAGPKNGTKEIVTKIRGGAAAIKTDGSVILWGSNADTSLAPASVKAVNSGVVKISSAGYAVAALKKDGSVVSWGDDDYGGIAPASVTAANSHVADIIGGGWSFAALKSDGSVVAWGEPIQGGSAPTSVTNANSDVMKVYANEQAYVALKSDGSVVAWGEPTLGGSAPSTVTTANSGVIDVFKSDYNFTALKNDGSVVSWGDIETGTPAPASVTTANSGVKKIFDLGTGAAILALKWDGSVVVWGSPDFASGVPSSVTSANSGVVSVVSGEYAVAALKSDGTVVAWGDSSFGGVAPASVTSAGSGIVKLMQTDYAFAALKSDGSIVVWGDAAYGGSAPSSVTTAGSGVVDLVGGLQAFAAVKSDGSVVAWGDSSSGGTAPVEVTAANSGVKSLIAGKESFAAHKADGSVIVWGNNNDGGDDDGVVFIDP